MTSIPGLHLLAPVAAGSSGRRRRLVLSAAAALAAAIVAARILTDGGAESPVLVLLTIPVGLVALELGCFSGLLAAAAGVATFAVWGVAAAESITVGDYVARALPLAFVGGTLGWATDAARSLHAAASRASDHDAMTGLFNRSRFELELEQHLSRRTRYGGAGAVLVLDLDNFKYINDTLGHGAGDDTIRAVGELLRDRLRESDVAARLSGDEFAVLLPEAGANDAHDLATDIVAEVAAGVVASRDRRHVPVGASIGIAAITGPGGSAAEVLAEADLAMYEAKRNGRGGVHLFDPTRDASVRSGRAVTWEERVHGAVANGDLALVVQPIVDLSTGQITHAEALLRMRGEDGALIAPAAFLPVAERLRMMPDIDRWVVEEAIAILARMPADLPHRLEINLSALSLNDEDLVGVIEDSLRTHGIAGSRLVFEVTETAAIANLDKARSFIRKLKLLGSEFALDDFGSGFGSYYYLKNLDFDYLKIDGEFIRDLACNRTDQLVVRSIVDTARGLGKRVVAECVEDAKTLALLRDWGVDLAQGFHLGRPLDAAELLFADPAVPA